VKQWQKAYPVKLLCRVLAVSRCGFYAWLKRPPCRREQENERLRAEIRAAHHKTRQTYSARRLQDELAAGGIVAGRDRIARLRREEGIRCIQKRKFKATSHSNHSLPVADNLLNQVTTILTCSGLAQQEASAWKMDSPYAMVSNSCRQFIDSKPRKTTAHPHTGDTP
jgi:putative transposase